MDSTISHATYEWMLGIQPSIWNIALALCVLIVIKFVVTVPGPRWASISDYYLAAAQIQGRRAQTLLQLHKQYGPVVRIAPNEVSCSDWRVYREIYSNKIARKQDAFYKSAKVNGQENIFTMSDKAMHSARRKMQSQPYSQQATYENESLIASTATTMVDRMISAATSSTTRKTVDVFTLCGLFSLEVILQCGFNYDASTRRDVDSREYLKAMDTSANVIPINATMPFLAQLGIAKYIPGLIGATFRALERWTEMTRILLENFERDEKAFDKTFRFMATPLLMNTDEYLGRKLSQDEILEEAMVIAFAGSGTTSTTLLYILYCLSSPEAVHYQDRLRTEIQEARDANGGCLDIQTLQTLPFLNAVIKETMRLHPTIISTLPRVLDTDLAVTLRSEDRTIVLLKGVNVGMQNYVHHRDPTLFPHPDSFVPERWLDQTNDSHLRDMNSALTPFSHGPRNCIGQSLAKAELLVGTAEVVSRLRLRLNQCMVPDDMEMEDRFNIAPKARKLVLDVEVI